MPSEVERPVIELRSSSPNSLFLSAFIRVHLWPILPQTIVMLISDYERTSRGNTWRWVKITVTESMK